MDKQKQIDEAQRLAHDSFIAQGEDAELAFGTCGDIEVCAQKIGANKPGRKPHIKYEVYTVSKGA